MENTTVYSTNRPTLFELIRKRLSRFGHFRQVSRSRSVFRPRREPLIEPSEPAGNEGKDNVDGDLIVFRDSKIVDQDGRIFLMKRRLGYGHFGQVYKVILLNSDSGEPKKLAMKISKNEPNSISQFQYESQVLEFMKTYCVDDLNRMSCFDSAFIHEGHACIVIELLGPSLLTELDDNGYHGMGLDRIQTVLSDILPLLSFLSNYGLVHCDIKPENILQVDKESSNVKLIDFGSCCVIGDPNFDYVQSRYYRAPEVALSLPFDSKADIWSLGCVAAELMLGLPLFPGQTQTHLISLIDSMLGPFPQAMVAGNYLFLPGGRAKPPKQICEETGEDFVETFKPYFVHQHLDDIIMSYIPDGDESLHDQNDFEHRRLFLDLLHAMLKINPEERITAAEAQNLPFMQIVFSK